jgi:predicted PhzF superfamily epimerase YddE/YHI9
LTGAREHPGLEVVRVFCQRDGSWGNPLGVFLDGRAVPEAERQPIATELGFSETVFVDDLERGEMRIFTPAVELPLAGHPLVGTAWLMRERGHEPTMLRPPAGEVGIRFDGELTYVDAKPEWGPAWEFTQLDSVGEVEAFDASSVKSGEIVIWAWIDEPAGLVRLRAFAPEDDIIEDEATGSAALILTADLGREIEIHQGRGSLIHARPLDGGRAEIAGRVVLDRDAEAQGPTIPGPP